MKAFNLTVFILLLLYDVT